MIWVTFSCAT